MAKCLGKCYSYLESKDVLDYFKYHSTSSSSTLPAAQPSGGDIYLFCPADDTKIDDWKCDQYRWKNYGRKKLKTVPVITKIYYCALTCDGEDSSFRRFSYLLPGDKRTLVHYLGDNSDLLPFPHGNSTSDQQYTRTCPSVLKAITTGHQLPSVIYKEAVANANCPPAYHPVLTPRNSKQIKNMQMKHRQSFRLTHDALYNLHELAYDLNGFVLKITTYPDLVVICANKSMVIDFESVLQLNARSQLLSYDTTFKLGDFYVSTLLFRHTLFATSPVMPAFFLIHERKFKAVHSEFMKMVSEMVPSLRCGVQKVPMVSDNEEGICQAIDEQLLNVQRFQCWNHVINASKRWLRSHGAQAADIAYYVSSLKELFHQPSEAEYTACLQKLSAKWSRPFIDYYNEHIHPEVVTTLGRWILEQAGVYNPLSGVTNNQSEGFNCVLKRLQSWREIPVDAAVMALYHLQAFYFNEAQRGLSGLGDYKLRKEYSMHVQSVEDMQLIPAIPFDAIASQVQRKLQGDVQQSKDLESLTIHKEADLETVETVSNCSASADISDSEVTCMNPDASSDETMNEQECLPSTQWQRAKLLLQQGRLQHNAKLGCFTVVGTAGKPHVVTLYPSQSCSCPATTQCYHIVAAKLSIGIVVQEQGKKVNLTQLRRNTHPRVGKKSGRKRPRSGDYEVVPAPDSQIMLEQSPEKQFSGDNADSSSLLEMKFSAPSNPRNIKKPCHRLHSVCEDLPASLTAREYSDVTTMTGRRTRCGTCQGCKAQECGCCKYCLDKPKYGGRGTLRQRCVRTRCNQIHDSARQSTSSFHQQLSHVYEQDKPCKSTKMVHDGSIYHSYSQPRVDCTNPDHFLSKQGRKRKVILGDGNCFFRAASYLMTASQDSHRKLRDTLVTVVEINRNSFEKYVMDGTFHDHIVAMRREGVWATQVELFAAATYFHMPLYVCAPHPTTKQYRWLCFSPLDHCQFLEDKSIPQMPNNIHHAELCHSGGDHYDCIVDKLGVFPASPPQLQCNSISINID